MLKGGRKSGSQLRRQADVGVCDVICDMQGVDLAWCMQLTIMQL